MFDRALDYRSMLMFCRSLMVGGFVGVASALPNRGDVRSMLVFCRSMLMVDRFDRGDVRSGFGVSIDIDVLSMLMVGGFDRDDVRSGFGLSIDIDVLSISGGGRIRWRSLGFAESW
jgi:hypothetical protein